MLRRATARRCLGAGSASFRSRLVGAGTRRSGDGADSVISGGDRAASRVERADSGGVRRLESRQAAEGISGNALRDERDFSLVYNYFLRDFAGLPEKTRSTIMEMLINRLVIFEV